LAGRLSTVSTLALAAAMVVVRAPDNVRIAAQTPAPAQAAERAAAPAATHDARYKRLLIKNAMVIYGNTKPPYGPMDILIENGLIARITPSRGPDAPAQAPPGTPPSTRPDAVIDATGKYVMPGIVNTHMHWHEERMQGIPMPIQYERNLYLASGSTTVREVGGDFDKTNLWRKQSAEHTIVAPRIINYPTLPNVVGSKRTFDRSPTGIRAIVREAKTRGADGLKLSGYDRDQLEALMDEAKIAGLPSTVHVGVEETTAKDYVELGVGCIEHFYGVADAALDGIQNFPPEHNSNNEIHRFGRAGELYIQPNLNPKKLSDLLDMMVAKGTCWSPTMSTYEASRDLIKGQNLPWYKDYLHPSLEEYYKPSMLRHGTYWIGWTNTQEVRWRRNYRVWMDALREFGLKGGLITTGDDAGYLYGSLYGFGMIRELELQEEAGFHPLEVLNHATWNGARALGLGDKLGKVRVGYIADLLVVNGNPTEDLRVLNPYGVDVMLVDGKPVNSYSAVDMTAARNVSNGHGGGIEWTIKDGIPWHVPTLMREVRDMVEKARAELRSKPKSSETSSRQP
jgi:imidazolonepropionase-like amidohydrolase